jgi:Ca-activated chloride channel homolog
MNLSPLIVILITLSVVYFFWRYGRESIGYEHINPLMRKHSHVPREIAVMWVLRVCVFILISALWIDLRIEKKVSIELSEEKNIIFALDISKSMKTDDVSPSRLDKAKGVLESFLEKKGADHMGLIVFAGRAFVLSPPTKDRSALRSQISRITTDTIDQSQPDTSGSNIWDALIASIEAGEKSGTWTKNIIILLTDGRANIGISPPIVADLAREKSITIYTVGIGSTWSWVLSYMEGGIRKYFYDTSGRKILADIDEDTLKIIAEKTGGRYFSGRDEKLLDEIFEELDTIVISRPQHKEIIREISLNWYISILIVSLIGIHLCLQRFLRKKYKQS